MKKNRDYTFKVYKDEFDDWVCEYTDIPGMIGVGETKEEAIREADLFLNAYLDELDKEGREYPKIKDTHTYSGRITLRISRSTHREVVFSAQNDGVSINQWVTDAVNQHLGRYQISNKIKESLDLISEYAIANQDLKKEYLKTSYQMFDENKIFKYFSGETYAK